MFISKAFERSGAVLLEWISKNIEESLLTQSFQIAQLIQLLVELVEVFAFFKDFLKVTDRGVGRNFLFGS